MKLGKINNDTIEIVNIFNGVEVNGNRKESYFKEHDYKPVCEFAKPDNALTSKWVEYHDCIVQEWITSDEEETDKAVKELIDKDETK